ncbi:MAG: hypothetical protein ACLR6O_01840 [Eubacterium sp.]
MLHKVKPLRKCFILIAKPDYGVNTGKAYALFDSNGKVHTPINSVCFAQCKTGI